MPSKTFYYARVSSSDQNESRQIEAFKKLGADPHDIIVDKESGNTLQRPGYLYLKEMLLRPGDTLIIKELDRLSRSKVDIKNELEYFRKNHIKVKILDIPTTMIDFPEDQEWIQDMVNNILLEVMGSIAEQERKKIRRRQKEGIDAARQKNVQFGRPRIEKPKDWDSVISDWKNGKITAVKAMELLHLKKSSFYNLLKRES